MRTGTLKAESSVGSEEEAVRVQTKEGGPAQKPESAGRPDSADNVFIDDVSTLSLFTRMPVTQLRCIDPRCHCIALF